MTAKKTTTLERLRQVASKAFREQSFQQVSVAKIAAESHCSTATIYQIYGSKSALFMDVTSHASEELPPPRLRRRDEPTLAALLEFASERLQWLSGPSGLALARSAATHVAPYKARIRRIMPEQGWLFDGLKDEVQRLMDHGVLRRSDPRATAYAICAGVGYDCMAQQLMLGEEATVDEREVLRLIFTPLATRKGARQLNAFLKGRPQPQARPTKACVKLYDLI